MEEVLLLIAKMKEASDDVITCIQYVSDLTLLLEANGSLFNLPEFGASLVNTGIIEILLSKVFPFITML